MMENPHAEALEVLANQNLDFRLIVYRIAVQNPQALLDAVQAKWKDEARELVKNGFKIEAIKLCRSATGWPLKEAKEAVEAL